VSAYEPRHTAVLAAIGRAVAGDNIVGDDLRAAQTAVDAVGDLVARLGLPTRLREVGIGADAIPLIAAGATGDGPERARVEELLHEMLFRVVQLTPPGSACSIALMKNTDAAGSVQGLRLIVSDIDAARAALVERGTDVSEIFHFESGGQTPGPDPQRGDYGSFLSFGDPDGNSWLVQEVRRSELGT